MSWPIELAGRIRILMHFRCRDRVSNLPPLYFEPALPTTTTTSLSCSLDSIRLADVGDGSSEELGVKLESKESSAALPRPSACCLYCRRPTTPNIGLA